MESEVQNIWVFLTKLIYCYLITTAIYHIIIMWQALYGILYMLYII